MSEEINSLIALAEQDETIRKLKQNLVQTERRLKDARKSLTLEEKALKEMTKGREKMEKAIQEKTATAQVALDTIEKFKEHLKRVHNQKEYSAAQKQLDEARKINDQMQNEVIEVRIQLEELLPKIEEAQTRAAHLAEAFAGVEREILGERDGWNKELSQAEENRKQHLPGITPKNMSIYTRIFNSGRGPALVPVVGGVCGGCNIAQPPQDFNRMLANRSSVYTCPHCGRMTYFKDVPAE
ncbi:MAG: C4-type zinc ribbon domain-containing protein [Deltaproteobacteria bacterium]|nr:C4-type zinc ribbon domain-containing protein [Deltaproteobacteria bacterium]